MHVKIGILTCIRDLSLVFMCGARNHSESSTSLTLVARSYKSVNKQEQAHKKQNKWKSFMLKISPK